MGDVKPPARLARNSEILLWVHLDSESPQANVILL